MTGATQRLPAGFERLEPFVEAWAQQTTAARSQKRGASSEADRKAFYDAARDLLPAALAYLDAKPLGAFDELEKTLMDLMLALGHIALAIEVQGPEEANHRLVREQMRITRSPADQQV